MDIYSKNHWTMTQKHIDTLNAVKSLISSHKDNVLLKVCQELDTRFEHFNWTGFYFMNHDLSQLEVGPYVGETTDHVTIPFGKGICGQVAVSGETFISQDVHSEENYLACSISTQAEIVVPIFNLKDELAGQLDIDSHYKNSITKDDEKMLFAICEELRGEF
jgi:GAF domain-containing protein